MTNVICGLTAKESGSMLVIEYGTILLLHSITTINYNAANHKLQCLSKRNADIKTLSYWWIIQRRSKIQSKIILTYHFPSFFHNSARFSKSILIRFLSSCSRHLSNCHNLAVACHLALFLLYIHQYQHTISCLLTFHSIWVCTYHE